MKKTPLHKYVAKKYNICGDFLALHLYTEYSYSYDGIVRVIALENYFNDSLHKKDGVLYTLSFEPEVVSLYFLGNFRCTSKALKKYLCQIMKMSTAAALYFDPIEMVKRAELMHLMMWGDMKIPFYGDRFIRAFKDVKKDQIVFTPKKCAFTVLHGVYGKNEELLRKLAKDIGDIVGKNTKIELVEELPILYAKPKEVSVNVDGYEGIRAYFKLPEGLRMPIKAVLIIAKLFEEKLKTLMGADECIISCEHLHDGCFAVQCGAYWQQSSSKENHLKKMEDFFSEKANEVKDMNFDDFKVWVDDKPAFISKTPVFFPKMFEDISRGIAKRVSSYDAARSMPFEVEYGLHEDVVKLLECFMNEVFVIYAKASDKDDKSESKAGEEGQSYYE